MATERNIDLNPMLNLEPHDSLDGSEESFNSLIDCLQDECNDEDNENLAEKAGTAIQVPEDLLQTDHTRGLSEEEVVTRRRRYGWNEMSEEKRNAFRKILSFFVGPIEFVMEVAIVLGFALQHWIDAGVISGLLILNATVGFCQEANAGSVVNELKKTLTSRCVVVRSAPIEINSRELVPGDVVMLEEGFVVPADGRLVTPLAHLQIDQSGLTGESLAVSKTDGDTVLQSSIVRRGDAIMIVTATADSTFVGRSAALVNAAVSDVGHFTKVIHTIGMSLLALVLLILGVVWLEGLFHHHSIKELLQNTLVLTNIGVPVGLPAVVTTTMAVGAAYLARKRAIVQKLSAIESLAGVEILCSDKTGTLTRNKLTVGDPYLSVGATSNEIMLTACLAASHTRKGLDAIDQAFLKALGSYEAAKLALPRYKILEFTPFDPVTKTVTAVAEKPNGDRFTCVKGAPMAVANMVSAAGFENLDVLEDYKERVQEFANRGFRSIGVARKHDTGPWQLLGIIPCLDPPRRDTAATIHEAMELGLRIKMLTGDAVGIAKETSRQLGLGDNIYNPDRIGIQTASKIPGSQLYDFVEAADGFAEVFPQHKYDVVDILQRRGYLVAMTGDGVNDAAALKKADTGIAVEGASDAARAAADIVFLAPGLSAIIDAIKTSREIFHRMYAYMVYRIALSIHLLIFLSLWMLIWHDHLDATLVAFLAMFADVATLTIAYDNAPFAKAPVKWGLLKLWTKSVVLGSILAAGSVGTLMSMQLSHRPVHGAHEKSIPVFGKGIVHRGAEQHAVMFLQIALTESFTILITRAGRGHILPSWQLLGAIGFVDILATLFCAFGWFRQYTPCDWQTLIRVWILSFFIFSIMAIVYYMLSKAMVFERRQRKKAKKPVEEDLAMDMRRTSARHARH